MKRIHNTITKFQKPQIENEIDLPQIMRDRNQPDMERKIEIRSRTRALSTL